MEEAPSDKSLPEKERKAYQASSSSSSSSLLPFFLRKINAISSKNSRSSSLLSRGGGSHRASCLLPLTGSSPEKSYLFNDGQIAQTGKLRFFFVCFFRSLRVSSNYFWGKSITYGGGGMIDEMSHELRAIYPVPIPRGALEAW